jgi:hypothetical protein
MDLIIGTLLLLIGIYILYISINSVVLVCPKTIEYRYLPRTFEEEQKEPLETHALFADMFKLQQPRFGRDDVIIEKKN